MPLSIVPLNSEVEVRRISVEDKVRKHLRELGITIGTHLTVIASDSGNVILIVKEGRLCLDKNIASRIMVSMAA